jgi:hydroxylamine reductase (hybrid-cluster protein)
MKKLSNTSLKIATLPASASLVEVFQQIDPKIKSEKDIQKYAKSIQRKIASKKKKS